MIGGGLCPQLCPPIPVPCAAPGASLLLLTTANSEGPDADRPQTCRPCVGGRALAGPAGRADETGSRPAGHDPPGVRPAIVAVLHAPAEAAAPERTVTMAKTKRYPGCIERRADGYRVRLDRKSVV